MAVPVVLSGPGRVLQPRHTNASLRSLTAPGHVRYGRGETPTTPEKIMKHTFLTLTMAATLATGAAFAQTAATTGATGSGMESGSFGSDWSSSLKEALFEDDGTTVRSASELEDQMDSLSDEDKEMVRRDCEEYEQQADATTGGTGSTGATMGSTGSATGSTDTTTGSTGSATGGTGATTGSTDTTSGTSGAGTDSTMNVSMQQMQQICDAVNDL